MLKISNLSLGYKDVEPILSDANLRIDSGVWLLEGHNGSGKSTFMNFLSSVPGSIGNKFEVNPEAQTKIPQNNMLLDNNTSIPNVFEKDLARFIFKLNDVNIPDYKPIYQDRKMAKYSTGEKKAAVLHIVSHLSPEFLLLDEYIGNFDDDNLDKAFSYVHKMAAGGTIVIAVTNENDIKGRFENRIKITDKRFLQSEGNKDDTV